MKQKSILALVLGAILVLTILSTDVTFVDYDRYGDSRDGGRDNSDSKSEKERKS